MGMRIQCAQCHNHPFDRWTMDDYYSFAAFFSQIGRKNSEDPRERIVYDRAEGEVKHPVGGRTMAPKFLGGDVPDVKGKDRRKVLADWLASPENPYFAKNLANLVWAHFFGKGIIDPVDDVRVSNPPSNPELLDEIARKFTAYKYDFKKLVRDICTSRTYQLSTKANATNESDTRNFAKAADPPDPRRGAARRHLGRHRDAQQVPRPAARRPRGPDCGRQDQQLLPDDLRPRDARDGLLVRGEDGAQPVAGAPPLNGDTVNARITQGALVKKLLDAGKKAAT
jgi:hypothetical protein